MKGMLQLFQLSLQAAPGDDPRTLLCDTPIVIGWNLEQNFSS